jgi:hypothetical protein
MYVYIYNKKLKKNNCIHIYVCEYIVVIYTFYLHINIYYHDGSVVDILQLEASVSDMLSSTTGFGRRDLMCFAITILAE